MTDLGRFVVNNRLACGAVALLAVAAVAGSAWLTMAASKPQGFPPPAAQPAAPPPPTTPPTAPSAAPTTAEAAPQPATGISARLRQNGAGACAAQIDALAAGTMGNVTASNTVSQWATADGDKRLVSVAIGQRYPAGSAVPYGASTVIAAPNPQGRCDGVAVQVLPSPIPCDKIRESMAARSRQVADLAGIPLMTDATSETMLVPTVANTCVLVSLRTTYPQ